MPETGLPTLDQLRVFTAVAGTGSFSAAARRLNRAQSVVSYTIANLESQLGVALFERDGRVPALTEAGRALLADARRIGLLVDEMRARASGLQRGLEAEIALAVDVLFPTCALVEVLREFATEFPTVTLRLCVEALGGVTQLVLEGAAGLGVSGRVSVACPEVGWRRIGEVVLVAVAPPSHPLASITGPIPATAVRDQLQLVLTDRTRLTEGQDFGVHALRTWRLGDLGAKHAMLLAGLGWGNMPAHMVADDLAAGRLVRLTLEDAAEHHYELGLVQRTDHPPGPASRWLAERLERALALYTSAALRERSPHAVRRVRVRRADPAHSAQT
jgi:DNA-binding transcriptional LysR family regulator